MGGVVGRFWSEGIIEAAHMEYLFEDVPTYSVSRDASVDHVA